ncbi:MAG: biotin transporter BioY [Elusimicrobiota bacterium]|jgi:biotin transport system substrate-specific component|nr:biotin transporter BioY [Elusimicrobiota bacterium]
MKNKNITQTAFIALFAALISISCFIAVPVGALGVPIVLQNMIVILAGAVLGIRGAAAVLLFMAAGILGLPVFAGGRSGLAPFFAPAGGYLIGYFFSALFAGIVLGKPAVTEKLNAVRYIKIAVIIFISFLIIYIFGTARLAQIIMDTKQIAFLQSIKPAIFAGVLPYIIGDFIKLIILIPLSAKLRIIIAGYL